MSTETNSKCLHYQKFLLGLALCRDIAILTQSDARLLEKHLSSRIIGVQVEHLPILVRQLQADQITRGNVLLLLLLLLLNMRQNKSQLTASGKYRNDINYLQVTEKYR